MTSKATIASTCFRSIFLSKLDLLRRIGRRWGLFQLRPKRGVWSWTCITSKHLARLQNLALLARSGQASDDQLAALFEDRPPTFVRQHLWKQSFPKDGEDASVHHLADFYDVTDQIACVFNFTPTATDEHFHRITSLESLPSVPAGRIHATIDQYNAVGCLLAVARTAKFDAAAEATAKVSNYMKACNDDTVMTGTTKAFGEGMEQLDGFLDACQDKDVAAKVKDVFETETSRCMECKATTGLSLCSACGVVRYCSRACQKKNWVLHKHHCKMMHTLMEEEQKKSEVVH